MLREPDDGHRVPPFSRKSSVTFGAQDSARVAIADAGTANVDAANVDETGVDVVDGKLARKGQLLLDLVRRRDSHFRRTVMADGAMGVMLSLFLGELASVALTQDNLALSNILEGREVQRVIESLVHAGLAVMTGENPERRTVGLTPLGSARMRSFISDYPDI